tara:strand:+ start:674 stop:1147 length:474 start_codon:yes stop_codon:yes gene_type:complete
MKINNLEEYLEKLKVCKDPKKLQEELHIYDNWPVLLYGEPEQLFELLDQYLISSPEYVSSIESIKVKNKKTFDFKGFSVQMTKEKRCEYSFEEDKIKGLDHSVWLVFHPYIDHTCKKWHFLEMTSGIIELGEYIIKEGLTARFPKEELELNHVGNNF